MLLLPAEGVFLQKKNKSICYWHEIMADTISVTKDVGCAGLDFIIFKSSLSLVPKYFGQNFTYSSQIYLVC